RNARPWARRWKRRMVEPSVAQASEMTRVRGSRPKLFSALAAAEATTFATGLAAPCGAYFKIARASDTDLPRTNSITRRAFIGVTRTKRAVADAEVMVSL